VHAVAKRFEDDAMVSFHGGAQNIVLASQRLAHLARVRLQRARALLDVREEESHGARGEFHHSQERRLDWGRPVTLPTCTGSHESAKRPFRSSRRSPATRWSTRSLALSGAV